MELEIQYWLARSIHPPQKTATSQRMFGTMFPARPSSPTPSWPLFTPLFLPHLSPRPLVHPALLCSPPLPFPPPSTPPSLFLLSPTFRLSLSFLFTFFPFFLFPASRQPPLTSLSLYPVFHFIFFPLPMPPIPATPSSPPVSPCPPPLPFEPHKIAFPHEPWNKRVRRRGIHQRQDICDGGGGGGGRAEDEARMEVLGNDSETVNLANGKTPTFLHSPDKVSAPLELTPSQLSSTPPPPPLPTPSQRRPPPLHMRAECCPNVSRLWPLSLLQSVSPATAPPGRPPWAGGAATSAQD